VYQRVSNKYDAFKEHCSKLKIESNNLTDQDICKNKQNKEFSAKLIKLPYRKYSNAKKVRSLEMVFEKELAISPLWSPINSTADNMKMIQTSIIPKFKHYKGIYPGKFTIEGGKLVLDSQGEKAFTKMKSSNLESIRMINGSKIKMPNMSIIDNMKLKVSHFVESFELFKIYEKRFLKVEAAISFTIQESSCKMSSEKIEKFICANCMSNFYK
jgi:hypothetical protein